MLRKLRPVVSYEAYKKYEELISKKKVGKTIHDQIRPFEVNKSLERIYVNGQPVYVPTPK